MKKLSLFAMAGLLTACQPNVRERHQSGADAAAGARVAASSQFLFDATKAETAGNADWILDADGGSPQRSPSPAAATVTAGTSETYWTGALSSWGLALVKLGNTVETLPAGTPITYGTASPQDLKNYAVFVIDEPNTRFSTAEKTAILTFVSNGGGLFMISDHDKSDRNNDGFDSPAVWNDLFTNNSVRSNPFGLKVDLTNYSETSSNVLIASGSSPILNGSQGRVTQLKFSNGASITVSPAANASAKGLVWRTGSAQGSTGAMAAQATFGNGRVVLLADSSPADDGTGQPGNNLFPGWMEVSSHARLHLNASLWLAKQP